jgi:GT2 family glycosyltransferase
MRVSVIVPAHESAVPLAECLAALAAARPAPAEVIVVDDASADATAAVARAAGARLLSLSRRSGPAAARNHGARTATGDVLLFVDADVVVAPDAIGRVHEALRDPGMAAVFGSYDAAPRVPGLVSQYRNLLHHHVHQRGQREAWTFWAGLGAVRAEAFRWVGGFDARRFPEPSVEDIDLGFRLRRAGCRIRLDPQLTGTHLKRWTLGSVLLTDLARRALPWSRLLLEARALPDDLNLRRGSRWAAGLAVLGALALPGALLWPPLALLGAVAAAAACWLERGLFAELARLRGAAFAVGCVPLHLLHLLCGAGGFAAGALAHGLGWRRAGARAAP